MHEEMLKKKLISLIGDVNAISGNEKLAFKQQNAKTQNMSIVGGNGRLRVQANSNGFSISLSGKSLEHEMYGFLRNLFHRDCDGYKQTNAKIGKKDQPFWNTDSVEDLKKSVFRYGETLQ